MIYPLGVNLVGKEGSGHEVSSLSPRLTLSPTGSLCLDRSSHLVYEAFRLVCKTNSFGITVCAASPHKAPFQANILPCG